MKCGLIRLGWAACLLLAACQAPQPDPVETILKRQVVQFTEPPKRTPARCAVDAPLMGNGFTGIAIAGTPDQQQFYIARNDFWRLKSALDESYPLVLGKVKLSFPQLADASYRVEQHLYDATTVGHFQKGEVALSYETYVAATEDMMVIRLTSEGKEAVKGTVELVLPEPQDLYEELPLERIFPDRREAGSTPSGIQYISRAFCDSVDIPTRAAVALQVAGHPSGDFTLQPGETVQILCAFSSDFKTDDCLKAVVDRVEACDARQQQSLRASHDQWWKEYWHRSYVSLPDSLIEKQYYLSLYGTASCSRDVDFPPSIFGTWITQERPYWNGDYHLNYNHMAPYYALYSANRIEQAEPYYRPLLAAIPRGEYYAEKVTGISKGILLPVGAGPLGIETTRRNAFMEQYYQDWIKTKNVEDEGAFWGQKSNSAYGVVNLAMQFYHTWDKPFTERVYPYVKGVATFWENYLQREGDRYVIYNDAIHEGTVGTMNPILSLGLVRMVMQTALDMSDFLQVDGDRRVRWQEVLTHLADYPLQERNGKTVFRYTERGVAWWDGNSLGIQHIYPAGQIGLESDPQWVQIARNTIEEMHRWTDFNGSNSFFPAAVRVGYSPDSILSHLHTYADHTYPNGFQYRNPHGIENWSTVPNTINEMLCMGHQGVVRLFPVWPRQLDASFHQIRVEGAFLVSAALQGGVIGPVTLFSEQGRELVMDNPWGDRSVTVESSTGETQTLQGNRFRMPTAAGVTYRFSSAQPER